MELSEDTIIDMIFTPLVNPDVTTLERPFRYVHTEEDYLREFCYTVTEESNHPRTRTKDLDPGDFPNNIVEYYWIKGPKKNNEEDWDCLLKLNNGYYARYWADPAGWVGDKESCDMGMFISKTRKGIFKQINERDLQKIIQSKQNNA